jgi:hypothetical protein
MALQTFTTGQVLTAAQVSSLQANDYNQTVSTKTANYVLTIADLGSRVFMNAAGATTITVNTGIFAAGDTLWLGNIGAGACVVTAGTATVSKFSTASLTLSQYQGAFLYFVSTGVAILYSDAAGAAFPVTTKGDLFGYDTAAARVPIGANNTVLTADSAQALGLKWASPTATADSFTQIGSTTTLTGASSFTISGISGINTLFVQCFNVASSSASGFQWFIRPNNNSTGANYQYNGLRISTPTTYTRNQFSSDNDNGTSMIQLGDGGASESGAGSVILYGCAGTGVKVFTSNGGKTSAQDQNLYVKQGYYIDSNPITSVTILTGGGSNFTGGSFRIFGA